MEFLAEQALSPNLEKEQNSTANKQQMHGGAMRDAPSNDSIFKRFRTRLFALQGKYNRKLGDLVMDTKDEFSFQVAGVLIA
ncbi:hypothetical protein GF373_07575, partial [bacterium]|nr:hypothetical protein [bacterium]